MERVEAGAQEAYVDKAALARLQRFDQRGVDGGYRRNAGGVIAGRCADRKQFRSLWRREAREA